MNSYIFVNGAKIYKFKAKYSEINATPFCLRNGSNNFHLIMWKTLDYLNMSLIFNYQVDYDSIDVAGVQIFIMKIYIIWNNIWINYWKTVYWIIKPF